ncbi:MAG: hypothetical protein IT371_30910 [Deltaproteobacteria bacterium]|nr:hypothetical protein [Deltaproteobacteria bacterium]
MKPKTTADERFVPALPVISSVSPDLYISALIRLPPAGTTVDDPTKYMNTASGIEPAWNDAGRSASDLGPAVRTDAGVPPMPDANGSLQGDTGTGKVVIGSFARRLDTGGDEAEGASGRWRTKGLDL